jgi:general stress protein 26
VDRTQLVKAFLAAPRAELLADEVFFQALARTAGRDAVLNRFTAADTGAAYREASWSTPQADGEQVKVTGTLPAGGAGPGFILVFEFAGERISAIRQQPLFGGAPVPATPVKLTEDMKKLVDNALATRHPMIVAYVDAEGQPILSFRGSTQSFSDDQLAIWVRNSDGNFLSSIAKNPKVALMYRDEDSKATYQFQGRARVSTDEAARRRIYEKMAEAERNHDPARSGVALLIDLDRVEGWAGMSPQGPVNRVRMLRDPGK